MQLMMKQQQGSGVWGQGKGGYPQMVPNVRRNGGERPLPQDFSMATWPTLQQSQRQPGAGMRAMFLGDTGAKKERAGTGVFLPRRFGTPTETRKKPGRIFTRNCYLITYILFKHGKFKLVNALIKSSRISRPSSTVTHLSKLFYRS